MLDVSYLQSYVSTNSADLQSWNSGTTSEGVQSSNYIRAWDAVCDAGLIFVESWPAHKSG